ncbi:glycoside hydrolase family 32 protein [Microbacterium aurantiacum]|uniref:glycoside hydrolase family 32 protein n=1 Tax=Microbacterium aurantiacum TaxID=162393 RepID=UPI004036CD8C
MSAHPLSPTLDDTAHETPAPSADLLARAARDPHRPAFHFVSPAGWLNDPNGLVQRDGWHHLFYQYNPEAPVHARIHWGHARSRDLVHWEHLPIALAPSDGPDVDGCWSGVFVDDGGVPTLVYSGRRDEVELACVATGSDDLLEWRKDPGNPVIAAPPSDLDVTAYRDHCVWSETDAAGRPRWRQIVGSGIRGVGGTALLYESDDLRAWRYIGPLVVGDAENAARTAPDWTGTMWECVDLFRVDGTDALVFSAWDEGVTHHPLYWTGRYAGDHFTPETLHRLDLGGRFFYAPQSMRDEAGRRVMFGWMQEGRPDAACIDAGWSGVMSLPRVVTARADGSLHQEPAREIAALRQDELFDGTPTAMLESVATSPIRGDQLDLEIVTTVADGERVEIAVRATGDSTSTDTASTDTTGPAERTVYVLKRTGGALHFSLDRAAASLDPATDARPLGGEIPSDAATDPVHVRILVDHSALEAFVNGVPLAARVYPTRPDALGVTVAGAADDARVRAWRMAGTR